MRLLVSALAVLVVGTAQAQFSGFASASYGYHSDPMYNYETIPDQLRQGYLELHYAAPAGAGVLSGGYVGGLMVFNEFTDRNYLEHSARVAYRNAYGTALRPRPARPRPESDEGEVDEEDDEDERPQDPDSVRTYLDLQLRASARHDKEAYREFNNTGYALCGVVRLPVGRWYLRIANDLDLRTYANLAELSNLTEYLTLHAGRVFGNGVHAGIFAAGGTKYYTTDVYDTTQFESQRTYVEKENGKGKGGAKLIVASDKKILTNATATVAWQIAAGMYGAISWEGGELSAEGRFRFNPGDGTRYLAQYANTSMLNEDIYNDFFSYEGPEGKLVWRQRLPLGLQSVLTGGIVRRQFAAPALDLMGTETGEARCDSHGYIELWLSRYIQLGGSFGLDLAVSGAVTRNDSNDAYNDYSLYQVGISLGVGF